MTYLLQLPTDTCPEITSRSKNHGKPEIFSYVENPRYSSDAHGLLLKTPQHETPLNLANRFH